MQDAPFLGKHIYQHISTKHWDVYPANKVEFKASRVQR